MFFLPLLDGNSQGLEHVVQLPEKRCEMRAADDNLNLGLFPKRLLRFQYLVTMRFKSFRLQLDADKREVISSVVDRNQISHNVPRNRDLAHRAYRFHSFLACHELGF
jgi:hypothetical protein